MMLQVTLVIMSAWEGLPLSITATLNQCDWFLFDRLIGSYLIASCLSPASGSTCLETQKRRSSFGLTAASWNSFARLDGKTDKWIKGLKQSTRTQSGVQQRRQKHMKATGIYKGRGGISGHWNALIVRAETCTWTDPQYDDFTSPV